jgi:hypothetical protein
MSVYGQIITRKDVRMAALNHLQNWLPAYLAEIGDQQGLPRTGDGSIPAVRSYSGSGKGLSLNAGNQLPACVVICAGTVGGRTENHGNGDISAEFAVGIGFIVSATDWDATNDLLGYYTGAARALFLQHPSLGGFAADTRWIDETFDELPFKDARTLAGGIVNLGVRVDWVVNSRAGLKEPPADPSADPGDFGQIHTADVIIEGLQ